MNRTQDFPPLDFEGITFEIWQGLGTLFYHASYVKTYADTRAMRLAGSNRKHLALGGMSEPEREQLQEDLIVFRAHFAALLWELWHLRELVREGYRRSKQENIISQDRHDSLLKAIDSDPTIEEIRLYRNMCHQRAGVIVTLHAKDTDEFAAHVFPPLHANAPAQKQEVSIDDEVGERELNMKVRTYCAHVGGYCEGLFKIIDAAYKTTLLPRSRGFSVTVPYSYEGELPLGAKDAIYVRTECSVRA